MSVNGFKVNNVVEKYNYASLDNLPDLEGAIAGAYSSTSTYNVGDYVWYNGSLYRCKTAITTGEAWTAAHWTAAVLGNDAHELKSTIIAECIVPITWEQGRLSVTGGLIASNYAIRSKDFIYVDDKRRSISVLFGDYSLPSGSINLSCTIYEYSATSPATLVTKTEKFKSTGNFTISFDATTVAFKIVLQYMPAATYLLPPSCGYLITPLWNKDGLPYFVYMANEDIDFAKKVIDNFGVNIEWQQGTLSATGVNADSTYTIRSKNYIPITENDTLYADIPISSGAIQAWFYDSDKTFLSRTGNKKSNLPIPTGAAYMRVAFAYDSSTNIGVDEAKKVHIYCTTSNEGNILRSFCGDFIVPDWSANTNYIVGNIVNYNGTTHICKTAHTSGVGFDSNKFSASMSICRRTSLMSGNVEVNYSALAPDVTRPAGQIYYNVTYHRLFIISISNGQYVYEIVPTYSNTIYTLDGVQYRYDNDKCILVPVDQNYNAVFNKAFEYSTTGKGITANGAIASASAYNISEIIELCEGDKINVYTTVSSSWAVISKTDVTGSYYTPLVLGIDASNAKNYTLVAKEHMYIVVTARSTGNYTLTSKKIISQQISPDWEMLGSFNRYGTIIQSISQSAPNYSISKPIKLYSGDVITMTCWATANNPALLEYQDRWNTYWANTLGNANVLIMPTATGTATYKCRVPKTAYYVFSCDAAEEHSPQITLERSQYSASEIDSENRAAEDSYSIEQHNYVDQYDFVPDLVAKRANAILTYSADDKVSSNYMVNAVAYPNGEIIACRAGGQVVKVANDGTESVLLTIENSQDWRGMFMDSNLNVYVSPHAATFSPSVSAMDRGLYRLAYGSNTFTKVISLCRSITEITEWTSGREYAVGDKIMRDNQSDMYICSTAHTSGAAFDPTKWTAPTNWAANTAYAVGDLCIYNRCYFRCHTNHTSGSTFDISKWHAATEYMLNDDTIWTLCEDEKGHLYAGVYSHSVRANPAIYRSLDNGLTWFYQHNFIMNGTLPESVYGFNAARHVHCVNFNPYDCCLYAAVGEVNTIVKSSNHGATWKDLHVACYYGQPTYVLGAKDGLVIGSDGHYSCGVSKLMTDGKTMKLCGRTAPGFIFNIRRSDLTGWLYAWTRIDNIVENDDRCPPYEAIDDVSAYNEWVENADPTVLRFWNSYHEWAEKYYPEDARRPQNAVIMVSKDEGDTWEVINKVKVSQNKASICGYITVGYFRDGECLAGLLKPINGTESGKAFVEPVVISEGKKKRTSSGYDLTGEIFVKTNTSNIVQY